MIALQHCLDHLGVGNPVVKDLLTIQVLVIDANIVNINCAVITANGDINWVRL